MTAAITIPDELQEFVTRAIQSGQFTGPNEMIATALYAFRDQAELEAIKLARLRRDIAVGLEQADRGEYVEFDAASIIAECQKERAAGTTA
jgi:antitoxin ParD1/3/4